MIFRRKIIDSLKISQKDEINELKTEHTKELKQIKKSIDSKRPEIIEIILKKDQKIIPKLQFGNPIEDMSPLLPRNEFFENMEIKTIKRDKKIFEAN